ncbi:type II toxin-antitoxin system ParD family antitoxin [Thiothrix subterranea]|uniref:Antitoxin ParD n=1 Tax=Thiothrix subterranea TaxID=2735563 RepID=A0AA51QW93_9GAMM|nr:type II toxin-antitoxin system ParD family antitoxin [Thiothrix subterranea]MDQ5770950.1 type II toxin-antitoxin system ParD family antitoxin [Thiothrix subterranea]WML85898.1 type II toxin-antitoxin system ParD family antitoxin [Thiothrix subterranea]
MATLNISLPDQLRDWISTQITCGRYSSASDYLRDLIRNDQRAQTQDSQWLANHLQARTATPDEAFVASSAADVKARVRKHID